ncbi:MAG: hypothetical protein H6581_19585 [Bacteroidia bacterium]|nr:hypothetical protein [Bacteroidia bacterium]
MAKFIPKQETFIRRIESIHDLLAQGNSLKNCTLQDLDLTQNGFHWEAVEIENTTFLGCRLFEAEEMILRRKGARIYPRVEGLPYNPHRGKLYTWQELMRGFIPGGGESEDLKIYQHFSGSRHNPDINEALQQRIHDHAIDEALRDLLKFNADGMTQKRCVGFMGGHGTLRSDEYFAKTAFTAKALAEEGFYIVSGGGPGIMEATNLGAWFAGHSSAELHDALMQLRKAPHYTSEGYFEVALDVLKRYPHGGESLAIPTWFYGHEPSNLFATHIAKYFSNSIREDTLLSISLHGVVFAPGSAGTTQEIFMDATQNHYGTTNYYSPMVFLGRKRYEVDTQIYPLVRQLSYGQKYRDLVSIADEPEEVVRFLQEHPPVRVK